MRRVFQCSIIKFRQKRANKAKVIKRVHSELEFDLVNKDPDCQFDCVFFVFPKGETCLCKVHLNADVCCFLYLMWLISKRRLALLHMRY